MCEEIWDADDDYEENSSERNYKLYKHLLLITNLNIIQITQYTFNIIIHSYFPYQIDIKYVES